MYIDLRSAEAERGFYSSVNGQFVEHDDLVKV